MSDESAFSDLDTESRVLERIAHFYNRVVRAQIKAIHEHRLITYEKDASNISLKLKRTPYRRPNAEEAFCPGDTPEEVQMASLSFSWCCKAIAAGSDLPMIIEEITFFDMVPHRKIIVEVDGPGVANNTVAHTIIKLMMGRGPVQNHSPEELGITGDPTHEQYGFESGVDDFRSYVQGKTNNTPRAYIRRAFGYQYQCHLGHMERGDVTAFIVEAAARTTQKTVYNVLKEIGIGIRDLLVMAEHDFSREEDKILHVLERDLAALQREMGLRWDYPEYDHLDYVRYRVKECDGEGYNVCADAMRRLGVV